MNTDTKLELLKETNKKLGIYDDLRFEKNKNIVFVYSPPKVGSTTLITTLRIFGPLKFTVLHIHTEIMLQVIFKVSPLVNLVEIIKYNAHLGKNVYVIDVYRTPIEHYMSMYFENLVDYHFNSENVIQYPYGKLEKRFNEIFPHMRNDDYFFNIYNTASRECLPFDFEKGYIMHKVDNMMFIKLRLSDSNRWSEILTNLLKWPLIMVTDYETSKKKINHIYEVFKVNYRIPVNYYEMIVECPLLQFYLDTSEREAYLERWFKLIHPTPFTNFYTKEIFEFYVKLSHENSICRPGQEENHYRDQGCICQQCQRKRNVVRYRIIHKLPIGDFLIIHA